MTLEQKYNDIFLTLDTMSSEFMDEMKDVEVEDFFRLQARLAQDNPRMSSCFNLLTSSLETCFVRDIPYYHIPGLEYPVNAYNKQRRPRKDMVMEHHFEKVYRCNPAATYLSNYKPGDGIENYTDHKIEVRFWKNKRPSARINVKVHSDGRVEAWGSLLPVAKLKSLTEKQLRDYLALEIPDESLIDHYRFLKDFEKTQAVLLAIPGGERRDQ